VARARTRTRARAWRAACAACAACWLCAAGRAAAIDAFEIQVYDGTADPPGASGGELHTNVVASGPREPVPGEIDRTHETHLTLEPSHGMTRIWEVGGYLQTAIGADGVARFAGVKLRSKFVTPPGWRPHARLGVNLEVSWLPARFDPDQWGGEIRPIAAWEDEHWLLAMNPILDFSFTGPALRDGPSFEPALEVKRKLAGGAVAVGLEYYAGLGPILAPLPGHEQQHTLFEAADVAWSRLSVNVGLGLGLNSGSESLVVKAILGYATEVGAGSAHY
jgi:hypothetical protein